MESEFANEDVQRVMNKLLQRMQESDSSFTVNLSTSSSLQRLKKTEESCPEEESLSSNSPNKGKTVKPKDFMDVTLARMSEKKLKSQEHLKKIAETREEKEKALMRNKPEINKHSQKIGKRNEPVYERAVKEVTESKKALERVKEKLEKERNDKDKEELTFAPKLHRPNKKPRTKDQYLQNSQEWMDKTKKKMDLKREEIEGKAKQELKFTPTINNNSVAIVDSLGSKKPVADRLHEKQEHSSRKIQAMRDEQLYTFAPKIEENSRAIAKHKLDGPVHERLFGLAKRGGSPLKSPKAVFRPNRSFSFSNDFEEDSQRKLDFLFDLS